MRRHIEAFNAHDVDSLMACFGEEVTWTTGTDSFHGTLALRELFTTALRGLSPTLSVRSVLVDGGHVACELREDFVVEDFKRTDHIAGFYRVASGLIIRAKIYREGSADV